MKNKSSLVLVVLAVLMVSYSGPMIKGALGEGATPGSIAFVRMLSAGLLIFPYELWQIRRKKIVVAFSLSDVGWVFLSALFLAGHYLTWITSLAGTSTFASVALVCTQPLFVAIFSYLLFKERTPTCALPGAGLSFLGSLVIALLGVQGGGQSSIASNLLALLGAVLMAAHWLTTRHIRKTLCAEIYTPLLYLATAFVLGLCLPFSGGFAMPSQALPYMVGLVVGSTLLGHAVFSYVLSNVSANLVSFALLGEPIGAMVFSLIFFGEIPSPMVMVGGCLTLVGLWWYLSSQRSLA